MVFFRSNIVYSGYYNAHVLRVSSFPDADGIRRYSEMRAPRRARGDKLFFVIISRSPVQSSILKNVLSFRLPRFGSDCVANVWQ